MSSMPVGVVCRLPSTCRSLSHAFSVSFRVHSFVHSNGSRIVVTFPDGNGAGSFENGWCLNRTPIRRSHKHEGCDGFGLVAAPVSLAPSHSSSTALSWMRCCRPGSRFPTTLLRLRESGAARTTTAAAVRWYATATAASSPTTTTTTTTGGDDAMQRVEEETSLWRKSSRRVGGNEEGQVSLWVHEAPTQKAQDCASVGSSSPSASSAVRRGSCVEERIWARLVAAETASQRELPPPTDPPGVEHQCHYFPDWKLLVLPNTRGTPRAALRHAIASNTSLLHHLREVLALTSERKPQQREGTNETVSSSSTDTSKAEDPHPDGRVVLLIGCTDLSYLRRQLSLDRTHRFIVLHHSLLALRQLSEAIMEPLLHSSSSSTLEAKPASKAPDYHEDATSTTRTTTCASAWARVCFLRASEAMFPLLNLFPAQSVDLCVVPFPVPFWSASSSYRRVVHHDFLCAVHHALRVRTSAQDPRGVLLFTDCPRYAEFMLEALEGSKFMVPWSRKRVLSTASRSSSPSPLPSSSGSDLSTDHPARSPYHRWLPVWAHEGTTPSRTEKEDEEKQRRGEEDANHHRQLSEFPRHRRTRETLIPLAASKSGPTSAAAAQFLKQFDFSRRYFRSLYDGATEQHPQDNYAETLSTPSSLHVTPPTENTNLNTRIAKVLQSGREERASHPVDTDRTTGLHGGRSTVPERPMTSSASRTTAPRREGWRPKEGAAVEAASARAPLRRREAPGAGFGSPPASLG